MRKNQTMEVDSIELKVVQDLINSDEKSDRKSTSLAITNEGIQAVATQRMSHLSNIQLLG